MENDNSPATRQDIQRLEQSIQGIEHSIEGIDQRIEGIDQRIEGIDQRIEQLRSEMNHAYNDVIERMADAETRLLRAFYNFVESNQKRIVEIETNEAALRSRIGTIETRLIEVEKRLNIPPAA